MKKLLYVLLLGAALLTPERKQENHKLLPVELVSIRIETNQVILETDSGEMGIGSDVSEAVQNLKDTAPGNIYLDTADTLLIGPGGEVAAYQLAGRLKGSIRVCLTEEQLDLEQAAEYLGAHRPQVRLKDFSGQAERLQKEGDRLILKEMPKKEEKGVDKKNHPW